MTNTFTNIIDNLKTTLTNDVALNAYATAKWGKVVTARTEYRHRPEIQNSELPIILITRPAVKKEFLINVRETLSTVRLYCGFYETDKDKAQEEIVQFEELIDDAILVDWTRGGYAIMTNPVASENDEGIYHPSYFIVMDIEIRFRRL